MAEEEDDIRITDDDLEKVLSLGRQEMDEEEGAWEDWETTEIVTIKREGPGFLIIDSDLEDDTVSALLARAFVQFNQVWEVAEVGGDEEYEDDEEGTD